MDNVLSDHKEFISPYCKAIQNELEKQNQVTGYYLTDVNDDGDPDLIVYHNRVYDMKSDIYSVNEGGLIHLGEESLEMDTTISDEERENRDLLNPNRNHYLMFGLDNDLDKQVYGWDIEALENYIMNYKYTCTDMEDPKIKMERTGSDGNNHMLTFAYSVALAPSYDGSVYVWTLVDTKTYIHWKNVMFDNTEPERMLFGIFVFGKDKDDKDFLKALEMCDLHINGCRSSEEMMAGNTELIENECWNEQYFSNHISHDVIRAYVINNSISADAYTERFKDHMLPVEENENHSSVWMNTYDSSLGYSIDIDWNQTEFHPSDLGDSNNLDMFQVTGSDVSELTVQRQEHRTSDDILREIMKYKNNYEEWLKEPKKKEISFGADGVWAVRCDGTLINDYMSNWNNEFHSETYMVHYYIVDIDDAVLVFTVKVKTGKDGNTIPDNSKTIEGLLDTVRISQ